jgi:hypothetical protein
MGNGVSPGKPTTRLYSPEEEERAVRLVRQLRACSHPGKRIVAGGPETGVAPGATPRANVSTLGGDWPFV